MPAYWDMEHHKVDFWHKNAVQGQEAYAQASESWNRERQFTMINIQRLQQMRDWFEQPRTQDVIHGRPWALQPSIDNRPPERSLGLPSLTGWGQPRQQPKHDERIVAIIDAGGKILDELQDIELSNERTAVLSTKAVLRPIKVRDAKRFPDVTKPSIYSIADGRGVGWISCMIQATGTLQMKKCQCCTNNESPFEGCIAVGGDAFPKCGNCEWNGKSCQGLEPSSPANISSSRPCSLPSHFLTRPKFSGPSSGPPTTAALAKMKALTVAPQTAAAKAYTAHFSPSRVSVSGLKAVSQASMYEAGSPVPSAVPCLAASNATSYRPCSKLSISAPPSSYDITKESLVLQHDGRLYTSPICVEGVPVEKITSGHPYWEPTWPDLRTLVEPTLRSWEKKYQAAEEASRRGETVGNVKYHYGRQVGRGKTILNFLEQGAISPYQLLNKQFMAAGRGSIATYDTLFRLCETIEALANYNIDVEPVDWLRQRLHELIQDQGTGFNFSKTIFDFYNDPKLAALREKSGFVSIERPPGIKMPRQRAGGADEAPSARRSRSRKRLHSNDTQSPPADSVGEPSTVDADADKGPARKKQKATGWVLNGLETGEVSDTDSWSGAPIAEDEFRIYQIKTRQFTSSENVTQYWGWVLEDSVFEHQVLEGTKPVVWGVHREPIDFSLRLEDVIQISWNLEALRAHLVMSDRQICVEDGKPRGDIMVAFKRENTMRRFLMLCRREELELVEETREKMEHLWGAMQSERLPAGTEAHNTRLQELFPSHGGSAVNKTNFPSET